MTADLGEALDGAELVSEAITEALEPKRALLARVLELHPTRS